MGYVQVLDACMKNCGDEFHQEVFSKSFMDAMKTVVKVTSMLIKLYHRNFFVDYAIQISSVQSNLSMNFE